MTDIDKIMALADGYMAAASSEDVDAVCGTSPQVRRGRPTASAKARAALLAAVTGALDLGEPVAWIDRNGHPHHLSEIQGVRDRQLYGAWEPVFKGSKTCK